MGTGFLACRHLARLCMWLWLVQQIQKMDPGQPVLTLI